MTVISKNYSPILEITAMSNYSEVSILIHTQYLKSPLFELLNVVAYVRVLVFFFQLSFLRFYTLAKLLKIS